MNVAEIKQELRFAAIEYMLANLYSKVLAGAPISVLKRANEDAIRDIDSKTFPNLGPAWSDAAAQELADNVRRVMRMIEEMMEGRSGTSPKPR